MAIILPEIVSAGIYNAQLTQKRTVTPNRRTTMFELELPIESAGTSYIDNEARRVDTSTLICAKAGQLRHTRLPFKCYYIHMIAEDGEIYNLLTGLPNFLEIDNADSVRKIFERVIYYYEKGTEEDGLMLYSLILELVYLLNKKNITAREMHRAKNNNQSVINETIEYIKNNITADLSLKSLADNASFSPIYFHKLFRASTGKTLHQYIEDRRIKKAINLLLSTNMTLSEIAYECGFSSQSYFSYAFKKNTGLTPRAYVKKIVEAYNE